MVDVRRILWSIAAALGASVVLFIVFISTLLLIQLMIAQFGAGLVALFAVWFVLIAVALSVAFYYGIGR